MEFYRSSKHKSRKKRVSIDMKSVCAWYRLWHGYVPMFRAIRKDGENNG